MGKINLQYPLGSYSIDNPPSNETLIGDLNTIQTEVNAQVDDIANVDPSSLIHSTTEQNPPLNADEIPGLASASSFSLTKYTWTNIKAFLKTYFDTLYKSFAPRTNTVTTSANPAINTDTTDEFTITALSDVIASFTTNLTGNPVNGQKLMIRILDAGVAKGITWGASFVSRGATLPTTTVLGKYLYVGLIWNSTSTTFDCVAVSQEA